MSEHTLVLGFIALSGLVQVGGLIFLALQMREMRHESRRFWTATGGTLIQVWRHLDPEGAARFDRQS